MKHDDLLLTMHKRLRDVSKENCCLKLENQRLADCLRSNQLKVTSKSPSFPVHGTGEVDQLQNIVSENYQIYKLLKNKEGIASNDKHPCGGGLLNNNKKQCPKGSVTVEQVLKELWTLRDCLQEELGSSTVVEKCDLLSKLNNCLGNIGKKEARISEEDCEKEFCEIEKELLCKEIEDYRESLRTKEKVLAANKKYIVALRKQKRLEECLDCIRREKVKASALVEALKAELPESCHDEDPEMLMLCKDEQKEVNKANWNHKVGKYPLMKKLEKQKKGTLERKIAGILNAHENCDCIQSHQKNKA